MVKNKRELLAMAAEWTNHAKNDMRTQLIQFMEQVGTNQHRLADVLGLSDGEIDQILNGNGEITLSTFAKLLIATDNVLEIKPMSMVRGAAPRNNGGHVPQMPRGGAPRQPQRDANGRFVSNRNNGGHAPQMPPMGGGYPSPEEMRAFEEEMSRRIVNPSTGMPHMGGRAPQMPPRFGGMPGMASRMGGHAPQMPPMGQPMGCKEIDLDELSRRELENIVRQEGLENEIDLRNVTRGELIDFLETRQQAELPSVEPRHNAEVEPMDANVPMAEAVEEEVFAEEPEVTPTSDSDERLAGMLLDELRNNPHLRDVVKRYMGE